MRDWKGSSNVQNPKENADGTLYKGSVGDLERFGDLTNAAQLVSGNRASLEPDSHGS